MQNKSPKAFLPEEANRADTYAYMIHLMDNLMLQLSENHTVIHPDGKTEEKNVTELSRAANAGS